MRNGIEFHSTDNLIALVKHLDRDKGKPPVFIVGSGLTLPTDEHRGVLGVSEILADIRRRYPNDSSVLEALDGDGNDADIYQKVFSRLAAQYPQSAIDIIVRHAVLQARKEGDPLQEVLEAILQNNPAIHACEQLEKHTEGWSLRPGILELGRLFVQRWPEAPKTIVTTNFDPLLWVSVKSAGEDASVFIASANDDPGGVIRHKGIQIVHIHGSWSTPRTLHAQTVLTRDRLRLENHLANLCENNTVIVLGHGGWEDCVTRALIRFSHNPRPCEGTVLWTFYDSDPEVIWRKNAYLLNSIVDGFNVKCYMGVDADEFLPKLRAELSPTRQAFTRRLQEHGAVVRLSTIKPANRALIQPIKFVLFEAEQERMMAVVPKCFRVDTAKLAAYLGCAPGTVRLMDTLSVVNLFPPRGQVFPRLESERMRIICDLDLQVQLICFPKSRVSFSNPDGGDGIFVQIEQLLSSFGESRSVEYAPIVHRKPSRWGKNIVLRELMVQAPTRACFVSETSGDKLNVSEMIAAVALYLLTLKDTDGGSHFAYLRKASHSGTDPLAAALRELTISWDENPSFWPYDDLKILCEAQPLIGDQPLLSFTWLEGPKLIEARELRRFEDSLGVFFSIVDRGPASVCATHYHLSLVAGSVEIGDLAMLRVTFERSRGSTPGDIVARALDKRGVNPRARSPLPVHICDHTAYSGHHGFEVSLEDWRRFLPETRAAFLCASATWKAKRGITFVECVREAAAVFACRGIRAGFSLYSSAVASTYSVSIKPVGPALRWLRRAEAIVLRSLPLWSLKEHLKDEFRLEEDERCRESLLLSLRSDPAVSSWEEFRRLVRGPVCDARISEATKKELRLPEVIESEKDYVRMLRQRIRPRRPLRGEARTADGVPFTKAAVAEISNALTAPTTKLSLEAVITAMGAGAVVARLRRAI